MDYGVVTYSIEGTVTNEKIEGPYLTAQILPTGQGKVTMLDHAGGDLVKVVLYRLVERIEITRADD